MTVLGSQKCNIFANTYTYSAESENVCFIIFQRQMCGCRSQRYSRATFIRTSLFEVQNLPRVEKKRTASRRKAVRPYFSFAYEIRDSSLYSRPQLQQKTEEEPIAILPTARYYNDLTSTARRALRRAFFLLKETAFHTNKMNGKMFSVRLGLGATACLLLASFLIKRRCLKVWPSSPSSPSPLPLSRPSGISYASTTPV